MDQQDQLRDRVRDHLLRSVEVQRQAAKECADHAVAAARLIAACFASGGKLMLCGNGGSAADAQHVAAEFVSRLSSEFERPGLPALALTTDTSFLTAYANDYSFEGVFARQVQALGKPGDVLMGISTSGSSRNVLLAMEAAKAGNIKTIAITRDGGKIAEQADVAITVPSDDTQHLQEAHLALEHAICDLVERLLYPQKT